jgi:hypothetical protein
MGAMAWMLGERTDAASYSKSAANLKARFNRDWWVKEEQFFALAMDPRKELVRAVTSNVGHCLATGIIDADHLRPVVGRLFAPDMLQRVGYPHALLVTCLLQPTELPPRHGVGSGAGDDPVRVAAVWIRRART